MVIYLTGQFELFCITQQNFVRMLKTSFHFSLSLLNKTSNCHVTDHHQQDMEILGGGGGGGGGGVFLTHLLCATKHRFWPQLPVPLFFFF